MRLVVLHVPGCPGAEILAAQLVPLLADRADIDVTWQVVTTEEDAIRLGMTGSPTLLVDGVDLFARPGRKASLACRLYRDEDGRPGPAPVSRQLAEALGMTGA